jgi:large subunit ribosomal protein L18
MINELEKRNKRRHRRSMSVRKHVRGSAEKPRLTVSKTNNHIFAQLIDDEKGVTLASSGTMTKDLRDQNLGRKSKASARQVGVKLAQLAKKKQIEQVVFDRGHNQYHGV